MTYNSAVYRAQGGASLRARDDAHLLIETDDDSKSIRLNVRNYSAATGDNIGVQIKPRLTVAKTDNGVKGLEVSPSVNDGIGLAGLSGAVIGIHADCYLRGTGAGTIGADVRAVNLEVVTDNNGGKTVTGNVNHIRIRSAFSGTVSGTFVPIRIEKAEAQTGSLQYDAVLELPSTNTGIWHDTENSATTNGFIKVLVNGNARYIQLYSDTPS